MNSLEVHNDNIAHFDVRMHPLVTELNFAGSRKLLVQIHRFGCLSITGTMRSANEVHRFHWRVGRRPNKRSYVNLEILGKHQVPLIHADDMDMQIKVR